MQEERTKVFVSYSHLDREWLRLLGRHFAVLERQGRIHLWSDEKIRTGDNWQVEIEQALAGSAIAILLVTADFLGSSFIWEEEIPHIWRHKEKGMNVLPVIARPCPWELEPKLKKLQVFPAGGQPLSRGSADEVDESFAQLTRDIVSFLPDMDSTEQSRLGEPQKDHGKSEFEADDHVAEMTKTEAESFPIMPQEHLLGSWKGKYGRNTYFTLEISQVHDTGFAGRLIYEQGAVTAVSGEISSSSNSALEVRFQESEILKKGSKRIDRDGEYRGIFNTDRLEGRWQGTNGRTDVFTLERVVE